MNFKNKVINTLMPFEPHMSGQVKHLQVGHKLNNFSITLSNKREVDLESILKNGPLILIFIKGTWCPFCTAYMHKIKKWHSKISKNVTLIVISSESHEVINAWLKDNSLQYIFGVDPDCSLGRLFGVFVEEHEWNRPATFLIDTDKNIRLALSERRTNKHFQSVQEECAECLK